MYLLMMLGEILNSKVKKGQIYTILGVGLACLEVFFGLYFLNHNFFIKLFGTSFFYRMDRLINFTESSSYQISNALLGIGSSGAFGMGLTSSKVYIPEVTTDFVFDLTICNFGYIAGIFVILIYSFILLNLYNENKHCKKYLYKSMIGGIFFMMLFQVVEHVCMNLSLTPITGITLLFLSYGGYSLISYFMLFGLVLKITTSNSSYS